jgi:hypothetical protein
MSDPVEYKPTKLFIKDGDDEFMQRRFPKRSVQAIPPNKNCFCGGKLIARGTSGTGGRLSSKCNRCGRREYTKTYKGQNGLCVCY